MNLLQPLRRLGGFIFQTLWYWSQLSPQEEVHRLIGLGMKVGRNFQPQNDVVLDPSHCWHITIGDDVTMAPHVHVLAHDASTKRDLGYTRIGRVMIGNRVFIGTRTVILPGVMIGDNTIIGAGSVVTKDIPSNSLAAGNPCVVIGTKDAFLKKRREEMVRVPCFGKEYTLAQQPTDTMKQEMNDRLGGRIGYIA